MNVTLPDQFCGPPNSANGGYTAGTLARYLGGVVEVTLRRPPPLGRPLKLDREGEHGFLRDGDDIVAEAVPTTVDLVSPPPVDWDVAVVASASSMFLDPELHPFPTCYVCGPLRDEGDGLRIFAGRVPGSDVFAAPWTPSVVSEEMVWAALDCPSSASAFADETMAGPFVLGRIAVRIDQLPVAGQRHVIMSWGIERDGRKVFTASAIFGSDAALCAIARATWIQIAAT